MIKVVKIFELEEMPNDKNGTHATGNLLLLENGSRIYEYENEIDLFDYSEA